MKHILGIMLFFLPLLSIAGPKDSIEVKGIVQHQKTRINVENVLVELLTLDSTLISKCTSTEPYEIRFGDQSYFEAGGHYYLKAPSPGKYLVRLSGNDYETTFHLLTIPERHKRKKVYEWEENFLIAPLSASSAKTLGTATVRATRIKMVHRGDTVVFNADAFQTPEGSMLDALLSQMQGMKINDAGEIFFNGKKVEELLVDGKSFFKDDPKMMLQNLPAYTVKKVEVYRKDHQGSEMLNHAAREQEKQLVVDVRLKREYAQGWMASAEGAGGTNNRYLARLFALRYTDHSRLAIFGTMNNLNDTKTPGREGDWEQAWAPSGTLRLRMAGLQFNLNDKHSNINFTSSNSIRDERIHEENKTSSVSYLSGGDTYTRSLRQQMSKKTSVSTSNYIERRAKDLFLYALFNVDYMRSNHSLLERSVTFDADPMDASMIASLDTAFSPIGSARLQRSLIAQLESPSYATNHKWDITATAYSRFKDPYWGNVVSLYSGLNYTHERNKSFSLYNLQQPRVATTQYQHIYQLSPSWGYNFSSGLSYTIGFNRNTSLDFDYKYEQTYSHGERLHHRLDSLNGWGNGSRRPLLALPSTTDSLHRSIDYRNSFLTNEMHKTHEASVRFSQSLGDVGELNITLPLHFQRERIADFRAQHDHRTKRHYTFFEPRVTLSKHTGSTNWYFSYNLARTAPSIEYFLPIMDTSDPLVVQLRNSLLVPTMTHSIYTMVRHSITKHQRIYALGIEHNIDRNAIGQARSYNRQTGVTTFQPQNINGNWNSSIKLGYSQALDSAMRWNIGGSSDLQLRNSVDFVPEGLTSVRSSVFNTVWNNNIHLTYSYKEQTIKGFATLSWNNLSSRRANFTATHALDVSYGLSATLSLPWDLKFNTDLTMFSRRGYDDASMNDNNLIWNASLSRSFLRSKALTFSLEGYDILGQRNTISRVLNAQGRTETWVNSIPRYALFRVVYRFHHLPKHGKVSKVKSYNLGIE